MAEPGSKRKHIVVSSKELGEFLNNAFDGWHHTINNGMGISKTVLAVVPSSSSNCGAVIRKTIKDTDARRINDLSVRDSDPFAEFLYLLHNRGETLQSRPDHMVLTRSLVFLVKGATSTHAASACALEGYACVTEPFKAVEASALQSLSKELSLLRNSDRLCPNCLATLVYSSPGSPARVTSSVKAMFYFLLSKGYQCPVGAAVNLLLSAAALHTGFTDAGAKFRDRTSRQEAARNYATNISALLTAPLLRLG